MRILIAGASRIGVALARKLISEHIQVVLIDRDRQKLEELSETIDCGMVAGDITAPAIMREAIGDEEVDALLALTDGDQHNILAALVGRSLGIKRNIPQVADPELEEVCAELGLDEQFRPEEVLASQIHRMLGDEQGK